MSRKQFCLAFLLICALGTSMYAQDEKNQLAVVAGRFFVSDRGISDCPGCTHPTLRSGKGFSLEGDYARLLLGNPLVALYGEVPFAYNFDEDLNASANLVPGDYSAFFVAPSARVNIFPSTAVSPWISFGGGMARFSENKNLEFGGANPGKNTFTGTIQGGIGLDVRFFRRFSLRGEARDYWSGSPDYPLVTPAKSRQHNFFVGGGIVWHF